MRLQLLIMYYQGLLHVEIILNRQMVNVYLFVVPGLEECEDKNQTPFDGCYQCQFQCDENCDQCIEGNCIECQKGYAKMDKKKMKKNYNQNNNLNVEIQQGNKMKSVIIEMTIIMMDVHKCAQLKIIKIIGNVMNKYQINAIVLLKYYLHTSTKHFINNMYIQKVKWIGAFTNFTQAISTKIKGVENKIFITSVIEIDKEIPNDPVYQFEIQFLSSKSTPLILVATIQDGVQDEHNSNLSFASQELKLKTTTILSNSQIEDANKFQTIGNYIIIGLGFKSALMLLLGEIQSSLEIFDTLQFQSYLRFIQQKNH
ncbi:unnamed protein product [Paramecium sonneborni]|uniref:Uncharacterized protein n=1 Tax=Paramecium sonneborni TaxID=65129 RepID=A0A8S1R4Z1_9CILI|nr:unnamed protein product [Paramecium sonneborni]